MLSYAFNGNLGVFVERLPDAEFLGVLAEIEASINIKLYSEAPPANDRYVMQVQADQLALLEQENKALKKQVSLLRGMYDDLLDKFVDRFGRCGENG